MAAGRERMKQDRKVSGDLKAVVRSRNVNVVAKRNLHDSVIVPTTYHDVRTSNMDIA